MRKKYLLGNLFFIFFQVINAQTYELHNSISFNNLNDARDVPDGITWYQSSPLLYGIYRTSGVWSAPNYQQLKLKFDTGIIIDGGSTYGRSGTFLQPAGGNVGIGTFAPGYKLDVAGSAGFGSQSVNANTTKIFLRNPAGKTWAISSGANMLTETSFSIYNWTDNQSLPFFHIAANGNIGIGTAYPDVKLTVNGTIHTKEVRVDIQSPMTVPDYVFENDYKLKSLEEIENFIKENKHLPEIPSAKEIEINGLLLAEMNISLLKKIEELTLYIIQQKKKDDQQNLEIEILKKEKESFKDILERLSQIEEKLK
jgi:hypothetical protein